MRILLVLWFCASAWGQMLMPIVGGGSKTYPAITLGVHSSVNAGASRTTMSVGPITPTAGSTMYCQVKSDNTLNSTALMTDNVNSGNYQPAVSRLREAGHNYVIGSFYHENIAASPTTITYATMTSGSNYVMACVELKGVPTSYAFDSALVASAAATGANPNSGSTLTPTSDGEIVLAGVADTATPTAGANYTLIDNVSTFYPQYWIQTTKTATTGPYTATTGDYGSMMAAFVKNHAGLCDSTMMFDWHGGVSDGDTVTTSTLQTSTLGGAAQPNGDRLGNKPGWTLLGSGTGLQYSTSAYFPLVTGRACPSYSGAATGAFGLKRLTSAGASHGASYFFETAQPKITFASCVWTDTPIANAGTIDVISIAGGENVPNLDYANLQMNSNGSVGTFALEHLGGGATVVSSTHWAQNAKYWIRIEYNQAGLHKIYIHDGCGASPTLLETLTSNSAVSGGGPADRFEIYAGAAMSYASGTAWYTGAMVGDILHGSTLLP